ncbi:hypothetical protein [Sphingomonas sp. IW22]|uniref:hypothetical protein n=1 Tax=Sphingomonas sp. IW22 TaxID=3242489 RepID=UPI00352105BD
MKRLVGSTNKRRKQRETLERLNDNPGMFEPTGDWWVLQRLSDDAFHTQLGNKGATGNAPWRPAALDRELARRNAKASSATSNRIAFFALIASLAGNVVQALF